MVVVMMTMMMMGDRQPCASFSPDFGLKHQDFVPLLLRPRFLATLVLGVE